MEFHCDTCGPLTHALYDGYSFGDKLLEGVYFEVWPVGTRLELKVQEKDQSYMSDLNAPKWVTKGEAYVVREDTLTCPVCLTDIDGPAAR